MFIEINNKLVNKNNISLIEIYDDIETKKYSIIYSIGDIKIKEEFKNKNKRDKKIKKIKKGK